MKNRKAFTLMELLVVIGIIAILAGILLPAVNHMRHVAQIASGKADLQAIATALDAYKADFGDYPRNVVLPKWNTLSPATDPNGRGPAPIYLSLATALVGAGPGYTQSNSIYQVGDGADGPGFRNQVVRIPVVVTALSIVTSPYSVTLQAPLPPQLYNFKAGETIASITMSVGTQIEETVGITGVDFTGNKLNLACAPIFVTANPPTVPATHTTGDTYIVKIATGKITPNYLPLDTFKVAYVTPQGTTYGGPATDTYGSAGEPVLLDRWGQVIQYFPRYGQATNRTNDSITYQVLPDPTAQNVIAGPLYGYSEAWSVENRNPIGNGQFAIYDFRDGAPFFNNISFNNPPPPTLIQAWLPLATPGAYFDPSMALLWMLGDTKLDPSTGKFTNAIRTPDKLSYDGPYILISAGPDGPNRTNGGFCNFGDPSGKPISSDLWQSKFQYDGNIYNFDRP